MKDAEIAAEPGFYIETCRRCWRPFQTKRRGGLYCCAACGAAYRRRRRAARSAKPERKRP